MRTSHIFGRAPLVAVLVSQTVVACGGGGSGDTAVDGGGGSRDATAYGNDDTGSADVAASFFDAEGPVDFGSPSDAQRFHSAGRGHRNFVLLETVTPADVLLGLRRGARLARPVDRRHFERLFRQARRRHRCARHFDVHVVACVVERDDRTGGSRRRDLSSARLHEPGRDRQRDDPGRGRARREQHHGGLLGPRFVHPDGNEDDIGLDLIGGNIEQSIPAGDSSTSGIIGVEALTLSGGVPLGAWHHVNLDVVVGPPATATVAIDSSVVLDAGALDPRFTNGAILVLFGVSGFGQTMHVDNVVVETKP